MLKPAAVALGVASPLVLHYTILGSHAVAAACMTALFALAVLWKSIAPAARWRLVLLTGLACVAAMSNNAAALGLVYAVPVALYLLIGTVFGRTLLPGREPLVCRIARLDRGGSLPGDLARYARAVTWLWTLVMGAFAAASLALAVYGTPPMWSWFNNVWMPAFTIVLFIGEYVFRLVRFRHYPHNNPLRVVTLMVRHAPELLR